MERFIAKLALGRLSSPDAADLIPESDGGADVAALREEAAAIRRSLEELAADRAVGLIDRAQMLAATTRANGRLEAIDAELDSAAKENVLAPLIAAENATVLWEDLDLSRKRAAIKALMSITLPSLEMGTRRAFDPATVSIMWRAQN